MSQPKPIKFKGNKQQKLIHVRSYLLSKGIRPTHIAPMVEFAGTKTYATKEEWEKIFSNY